LELSIIGVNQSTADFWLKSANALSRMAMTVKPPISTSRLECCIELFTLRQNLALNASRTSSGRLSDDVDGRLDNREELIAEICQGFKDDLTDVVIVAAAFDRWAPSVSPS